MMIKRKTKTDFEPFRGRLIVCAAPSAMCGHAGTANPADDVHRFGIGEGELHANADDNAKFGDQVIPSLEIPVKGLGTITLSPGDVHRMLIMIEEIQAKARHPGPFIGRVCSGTI